MKSIWNNSFYNTQPALPWTFDLSFDQYYEDGASAETKLGLSKFAAAAIDISIGKRESQYTDLYYGGLKFQRFTRAENTGTFTIKFNENKYYSITRILENIYEKDNYNQYYGYRSDPGSPYNQPTVGTRTIVVKMYDPNTCNIDQNPVVMYSFINCRIMSIDDITMSYESTSETIKRSVTFVYDHMIFRDLPKEAAAAAEKAQQEAEAKRIAEEQKQKRKEIQEKYSLDAVLANGMTLVGDQSWSHVSGPDDEDIKKQEAYEKARHGDRGGQGLGARQVNYSPIRTR